MSKKEAGRIKAKLTRAGWHVTGELYDRDTLDPAAQIIAVSAAPEPFADQEHDFYNLAQCPSRRKEGTA